MKYKFAVYCHHYTIFTALCYASTVYAVIMCLCVCVCHTPVLYQNG